MYNVLPINKIISRHSSQQAVASTGWLAKPYQLCQSVQAKQYWNQHLLDGGQLAFSMTSQRADFLTFLERPHDAATAAAVLWVRQSRSGQGTAPHHQAGLTFGESNIEEAFLNLLAAEWKCLPVGRLIRCDGAGAAKTAAGRASERRITPVFFFFFLLRMNEVMNERQDRACGPGGRVCVCVCA